MIGKIIVILSTGQVWTISRKIDGVIKEMTFSPTLAAQLSSSPGADAAPIPGRSRTDFEPCGQ